MSQSTPTRSVGDVLRTIASLRKFCLALPHAPTPGEIRQLERFERLRLGGASLTDEDIHALRTGLRACWRRGDATTLLEMASRIPAELVERDRWLQSLVAAAEALAAAPGRSESASRTPTRRLTETWPVED